MTEPIQHRLIFRLCSAAFLLLSLSIIWYGQGTLFSYQERGARENISTTPLFEIQRRPIFFGFEDVAADWQWLRMLQYVGGRARTLQFPALPSYLQQITTLDPHFAGAYHFGGILLGFSGQYAAAETLLKKGEQELPEDWRISYDRGFIDFYYRDDVPGAIAAYQRCIQKFGCLPAAKTLLATLEGKSGKVEIALNGLLAEYETASAEEKSFLAKKIEELAKLLFLQLVAAQNPPQKELSELRQKMVVPTPELQKLNALLKTLTGVSPLDTNEKLTREALQSPFPENPYRWDEPTEKVRPLRW